VPQQSYLEVNGKRADLELHAFLHRGPQLENPDFLVSPPADLINCCEVALRLKTFLDHFDLQSFPKTSGSKGLQVYVPLNTKAGYDVTKPFAHGLAEHLESENPDLVVSKMQKRVRQRKVLVTGARTTSTKRLFACIRFERRSILPSPLQ
jgi:bifunctional non-homologous end joining protein LigD